MLHVPGFLIDQLIEERRSVLRILEAEPGLEDRCRLVKAEIARLVALKEHAETLEGPVAEVAPVYGYTRSHVYTLIRDEEIENVAEEHETRRVRYCDLLQHRLGTPYIPEAAKHQTDPTTNDTASDADDVKITVQSN